MLRISKHMSSKKKFNERTERHKVKSHERGNLINAVLSWTCPEFSALILCNEFLPLNTPDLEIYVSRFLCWEGGIMNTLRNDMAELSGLFPDDKQCIKDLVRTLKSSFQYFERSRLQKGLPHIFFFKALVENHARNKSRLQLIAEEERIRSEEETSKKRKNDALHSDPEAPAAKKSKS